MNIGNIGYSLIELQRVTGAKRHAQPKKGRDLWFIGPIMSRLICLLPPEETSYKNGFIDGWMVEWVDEWMDGWMDR